MIKEVNMWRPDGWENPWSNPDVIVEFDKNFMAMRTADGTTPERVLAEDRRDIYEAGADAMLKALKKKGTLMTPEQMKLIAPNREYPFGYLVFIPDDD